MLKWLGRLGLALLLSLLLGLAIGTWLRMRFERPSYYIGAAGSAAGQLEQEGKLGKEIRGFPAIGSAPGGPTQG